MTPDEALATLLAGNDRFVRGEVEHPRRDPARRVEQAHGQTPFAIVLGCADSRVSPAILFDAGLGDLFSVRVAGNTAEAGIVRGSIELAAATLACPVVMVLGHRECGAVQAAVELVTGGVEISGETADVVAPIAPAVEEVRGVPDDQLLDTAVAEHVRRQVARLGRNAVLAELVTAGRLRIVGAVYDLHSGRVDLLL